MNEWMNKGNDERIRISMSRGLEAGEKRKRNSSSRKRIREVRKKKVRCEKYIIKQNWPCKQKVFPGLFYWDMTVPTHPSRASI